MCNQYEIYARPKPRDNKNIRNDYNNKNNNYNRNESGDYRNNYNKNEVNNSRNYDGHRSRGYYNKSENGDYQYKNNYRGRNNFKNESGGYANRNTSYDDGYKRNYTKNDFTKSDDFSQSTTENRDFRKDYTPKVSGPYNNPLFNDSSREKPVNYSYTNTNDYSWKKGKKVQPVVEVKPELIPVIIEEIK